jgi:hypothetical protein
MRQILLGVDASLHSANLPGSIKNSNRGVLNRSVSLRLSDVSAIRRNAGGHHLLPDTRPIKTRQNKRSAQHDGKILGGELKSSGKASVIFAGDPSPPGVGGKGQNRICRLRMSPAFGERSFR